MSSIFGATDEVISGFLLSRIAVWMPYAIRLGECVFPTAMMRSILKADADNPGEFPGHLGYLTYP